MFTIQSLDEAVELRRLLDSGTVRHAVVVGAGYIGLETAEALVSAGLDVDVVEALPRVLATVDEPVAALVQAELERHTRLHLAPLTLARTDSARLEAVDGAAGERRGGPRPDRGRGRHRDRHRSNRHRGRRAPGHRPAHRGGCRAPSGPFGGGGRRMRTSLPDVYAAGDAVALPTWCWAARLGPAEAGGEQDRPGGRDGGGRGQRLVQGHSRHRGGEGFRPGGGLDGAGAGRGPGGRAGRGGHRRGLPVAGQVLPGQLAAARPAGAHPGGAAARRQFAGREGAAKRVDVLATALYAGLTVADLAALDLSYAPPFAPVYDPVLAAAIKAARAPVVLAGGSHEPAPTGR